MFETIRLLIRGVNKSPWRWAAAVSLLAAASLACSIPGLDLGAGADGETVGTSVAATVAARTGTGGAPTGEPLDTDTPAPSNTATPAPTGTATAVPTATLTPTPEDAVVRVSGDTFCRAGPGEVYEGRGILNTDQESVIIARDPTGNFWYIENPDQPGEKCWIWGNYATPEGPTSGLPVYTPPPSPTPSMDYAAAFREMDECVAPWMEFTITNTGDLPLESFWIKVEDRDSGETVGPNTGNLFESWNACMDGTSQDTIAPGGKAFLMSSQFGSPSYSPRGEPLLATIRVCTQENLGGTCLTRQVSFTAPGS